MTNQQDPNQQYRDEFGIVTLPPDTVRFYANGTWYNVTDKIASGRMAAYQKATVTYGFGLNVKGFYDMLMELHENLNKTQFTKCAVLVYNAIEGLVKIDQGRVQAMEIVALFCNYDGEDAKAFEESAIEKKLDDWMKEGIDASFFLLLAAASAAGYKDVCRKIFQTSSEEEVNPS